MRTALLFSVSLLLMLSMTGTSSAVVIGDFENGSMDGWELSWEGDAVLEISNIGATSGSGSLSVSAPSNKFSWTILKNMDPAVLGIEHDIIVSMDVTWVASEWAPQQGMWLNLDLLAVNSDGPSGWQQVGPDDPVNPDWPSSWDPSWGDQTRTLSYDLSGYDATGATWLQVVVSMNSGNVTTAGKYYIDNISITGTSAPDVVPDPVVSPVIGDFENGSMDDWELSWEGDSILEISHIGATSGSGSLAVSAPPNKFSWTILKNMDPAILGAEQNNIVSMDVTWIASEWAPQQGMWLNLNMLAVNSDGPSGWQQVEPDDPAYPDWPGGWDPSWGDHTRTLSYDLSGYDATGATWLQLVLSMNSGGVTTAGKYYIDNVLIADTSDPVIVADSVVFADAALKALVEAELGVSNPTQTDMLELTGNFNARESGITSLSGLEYAINLQSLSLQSNQIQEIGSLAGLTNLTYLNLGNNQIEDISPLANMVNLESLYLYSNQIMDINPLANLMKLTTLLCSSNQISDVSPLANLTNLETLNCIDNQISDIDSLAELTNLNNLQLGKNSIVDISPLVGLTNLEFLVIYRNQITDLTSLSNMAQLQRLMANDNNIVDISGLSGLDSLERVLLSDNQISDISALAHCTGLTSLDLRFNPLNDEAYSVYIPQISGNNPLDGEEYTDLFGKVVPSGLSYDEPSDSSEKSSLSVLAMTSILDPHSGTTDSSDGTNEPPIIPLVATANTDQRFAFASASPKYLRTQVRAKDSHLMPADATASCSTIMVFTDNEKLRSLLGDQSVLPLDLELEYTVRLDAPRPKHWPEQVMAAAHADMKIDSFQQTVVESGTINLLDYYDWTSPAINKYGICGQMGDHGLGSVMIPITISPDHPGGLTVKVSASVSSSTMSWVEGRAAEASASLRIADLYSPDGLPVDVDYTIDLQYSPNMFDDAMYQNIRKVMYATGIAMTRKALQAYGFLSGAMNLAAVGIAAANNPLLTSLAWTTGESALVEYVFGECGTWLLDYKLEQALPPLEYPQGKMRRSSTSYASINELNPNDPDFSSAYDPNYYTIASVDPPAITVPGLAELEPNDASLLQRNIDLKCESVTILQAMLLTLDRNQEAIAADERGWAIMQDAHFNMLVHRLYWVLSEVIETNEEIAVTFGEYDLGLDLISPEDVHVYQEDLLVNGLSGEQASTLNLYGLTAQDVNDRVMATATASIPGDFFPMSLPKLYAEDSMMYRSLRDMLEPFVAGSNDPIAPNGSAVSE